MDFIDAFFGFSVEEGRGGIWSIDIGSFRECLGVSRIFIKAMSRVRNEDKKGEIESFYSLDKV